MNAEMNFDRFDKYDRVQRIEKDEAQDMGVSENCNFSVYSMLTVAGGVLMAIGAVVYSLIAM